MKLAFIKLAIHSTTHSK